MWAWDDEIVVLYSDGVFRVDDRHHAIVFDQPILIEQARSTDRGETWTTRAPIVKATGAPGFPTGGNGGPPITDLTTPVDFTAPGFALLVQMADQDYGLSSWYFTTDRAQTWSGPYSLPSFGYATVNARTDYIVNGPNDVQLTLSGTDRTNSQAGSSPFVVRSTDGGLTWSLQSTIDTPSTIQNSTVRVDGSTLVTVGRNGNVYSSADNGRSWFHISTVTIVNNPRSWSDFPMDGS